LSPQGKRVQIFIRGRLVFSKLKPRFFPVSAGNTLVAAGQKVGDTIPAQVFGIGGAVVVREGQASELRVLGQTVKSVAARFAAGRAAGSRHP